MDRLTIRNNFGQAVLKNALLCGRCNDAAWRPITEAGEDVAERIAAYEDTGLEPQEIIALHGPHIERLKELAEADKAGRLTVWPCKLGDTVYGIKEFRTDNNIAKEVHHGEVVCFKILSNGAWIIVDDEEQYSFPSHWKIEQFGEKLFLSSGEAKIRAKSPFKQTNFHKIRAMTDEELAEFISGLAVFCYYPNDDCDCAALVLSWLRQPAEGGEQDGAD